MITLATGVRSFVVFASLSACAVTAVAGSDPAVADQAARTAAEKFARKSPDTAEDQAARKKADEAEMLEAARREAAERRRRERSLDVTVTPKAPTDAPRQADTARPTVDIGVAPADRAALAKQREAELQRLSEKLRRASATRPPAPLAPVETPWTTEVATAPKRDSAPDGRFGLGHRDLARRDDAPGRVTVLMVMSVGPYKGIRRVDRRTDPVLCTFDGCYISNGPETPAQYISLGRTFGFANTFGRRAGACSHQSACVFRGVDIGGANPILQPVDMRVINHDKRAMQPAAADPTCRVDAGRLSCARPIRGDGYTLWVVPEAVAARVGTEALQRAVQDGLGEAARAGLR